MVTARDLIHPEPTQLDRIEAQNLEILALLQKKKRVVKPKGSKVEYSSRFNRIWSRYPKRGGNNPKNKAWAAFSARTSDAILAGVHGDEFFKTMNEGLNRYIKFCEATNKLNTEKVMHGATFFGPSDPPNYTLDWTIPKPTKPEPRPVS